MNTAGSASLEEKVGGLGCCHSVEWSGVEWSELGLGTEFGLVFGLEFGFGFLGFVLGFGFFGVLGLGYG